MSKRSHFLCLYIFILALPLCACSQELTNQTPLYAASNAIRFADLDSLQQFQSLFDDPAEANATQELLQSLKESSTSSAAHATCHFVAMDNGDTWLFRFTPIRDGEAWKITSIQRLDAKEAAVMKALLGLSGDRRNE